MNNGLDSEGIAGTGTASRRVIAPTARAGVPGRGSCGKDARAHRARGVSPSPSWASCCCVTFSTLAGKSKMIFCRTMEIKVAIEDTADCGALLEERAS